MRSQAHEDNRKIITGQEDDYATEYFLDDSYFIE